MVEINKQNMTIRLVFSTLLLPALGATICIAAMFHVKCNDQRIITERIEELPETISVTLGFLCLNVILILACIICILFRRDGLPFCISFHMFLVFIAIVFAIWSYYNDVGRYERYIREIDFVTFKNWTDDEALVSDETPEAIVEAINMSSWRMYNYRYFKFYDEFQLSHNCCGMSKASGYHDWSDSTTQEWLHDDLRWACTPMKVEYQGNVQHRIPHDRSQDPPETPEYCHPVLVNGSLLPISCLRDPANTDFLKDPFSNPDEAARKLYSEGCGPQLEVFHKKCITIFPYVAEVTFIVACYTVLVTYTHARQIQKSSFWTKFCCYCCWTKTTEEAEQGPTMEGSIKR